MSFLWKINKYEFKDKYIELLLLGDIHLGHMNSDEKELQRYIDWVLVKPNRYVIGMGDYFEFITANKYAYGMDQKYNSNIQVKRFIEIIEPIKDRILCLLEGNHEQRISKLTSLDITELIADKLDCDYIGYEGFVRISFGSNEYFDFYLHHGSGGSARPTYQIEQFIKLYGHLVDVIAIGHIHKLFRYDETLEYKDRLYIRERELLGLRTGSFLKYPQYAKNKGYKSGVIGAPILRIHRDRIECFLGLDKYVK